MSTFTRNINKVNKDLDVNKKGFIVDPGPHEGIIKNNFDARRTGRIDVFVPLLGGIDDDPRSWIPVRYVSPFLGQTNKELLDKQEESGIYSYGMWMTIPDPGTKVLVSFIEGNRNDGVIIGCLIDNINNHMIPGLASSKKWIKTDEVAQLFPEYEPDRDYMPVIEFNPKIKRSKEGWQTEIIKRPVNIEFAKILKEQGLLGDINRGQSLSSAQRENNSSVFGFSTPGRSDKDPATDSALRERMFNGDATAEDLETRKRFPGHTLVLDDGDVDGDSKLIRLRTSTGHQILMNDTAGVLYVGTSSGNAWIELNNNGDIDVYSKQTINMHTETNFNIRAGKDINIDAGRRLNLTTGDSIKLSSGRDTELLTERHNRITSKSGNNDFTSNGPTNIKGSEIDLNGADPALATMPEKYDLGIHENKIILMSTATRVPEREPWNHTPSTEEDGQQ